MLKDYTGTVITVSHDRYFIDKVCSRLAVFEEDGLWLYPYAYSEYEKFKPARKAVEEIRAVEPVKPKKKRALNVEKEKNKKLHRIAVLEQKIDELEKQKALLTKEFEDNPALYADYKRVNELENATKAVEEKLEPLLLEWTELLEQVENM